MSDKYRKKPVEIEAIQFDGTPQSRDEILAWANNPNVQWRVDAPFYGLVVQTLEGVMKVNVGDYIVRAVKGEFYPCKPDIFEATYDRLCW